MKLAQAISRRKLALLWLLMLTLLVVVLGTLDAVRLAQCRSQLPALEHRTL